MDNSNPVLALSVNASAQRSEGGRRWSVFEIVKAFHEAFPHSINVGFCGASSFSVRDIEREHGVVN